MAARTPLRRRIQIAGALVVLATLWMPIHSGRAHPSEHGPRAGHALASSDRSGPAPHVRVPLDGLAGAFANPTSKDARWAWTPYLLVLLWPFVLVAAGRGDEARRRAGTVMFLASLVLAAAGFTSMTLWYRSDVFAPGLRALEVGALMFATGWILFRRRGWRGRADVEGFAGAQALLGVAYALTYPGHSVLVWAPEHHPDAIVWAIGTNYLAGYWIALAGLVLVALPAVGAPRQALH